MAVDRSTIIQNAQRFMARGQIDKAIEEWQKLVSLTPQDGNLYNTIGDLYLKKNDTGHAVETFTLAAAAFERAGFALKTIAVYKKVLKVDPANLEVNLKLADLNAERGLTGNAIEDYLKVAKEYGRRGKVQEALGIYRKIANFDPTNTNIRLKLAELSLREKLVDESIDEYMKVAQMYAQNGRAADAAAIYKKILEINPKHAGARDAMKAGVTPSSTQTLPTVAEIEEAVAAEDWGLAGQKVGVLLLHEPTNLTLRRLRGKVLLHKGETALAWGDYRVLVEEAARAGQVDAGITLLEEYLDKAPQQAEPRELFAKLLDQAGRTDEALAAYAALIDVMIKDGLDEGEIRDHFSRMKELDSTSDITRRYQARFEPSTAVAESVEQEPAASEQIAEPVALEPADIEAVAEAVELSQDQPVATPEPSVSAGRSKPSVEPAALEPSISISRLVGTSQSLSRESVAPPPRRSRESAAPPPPPASPPASQVAGREPSISASRQPGASQSRSRETSATPGQKKRLRPRDLPDYFAEAEVYLKYGLASKAIEQFQMILSVDPNNIEAHAKLRELFQLEGRLEEAVTHSVVLARLYHARGQREQAEQTLAEAREWNPADPRLQAALDEQGPLGQPAPASTEEAGLEPQDATAQRPKQDLQEWLAEAEFYLQQGLDEQAHQLFETIRQHYPDAPEVAAYFEARQGSHPSRSKPKTAAPRKSEEQQLGDGLDDLADALNQSATGSAAVRDDASLSAKLADLFPGAFRGIADGDVAANDRLAASVEGVIRGVEQGGQPISPDGPDPHYSLGLAYKEMGLYAEARKEFEQTLQLPAYRIDAAVMMAACHQAEGQPRQAIRQLQECLGWLDDSDPKWLKVAHELAALYAEVGDQEQALAQVQRVLDVDAGYEPATALLERLKESPAMKEKEHERANAKPPKAAEPPPPAAGPRTDKTKRHRISYV